MDFDVSQRETDAQKYTCQGMTDTAKRDMSFAAWQYQLHGLVTKTMVTVVLFRAIVVVDYFWYENW